MFFLEVVVPWALSSVGVELGAVGDTKSEYFDFQLLPGNCKAVEPAGHTTHVEQAGNKLQVVLVGKVAVVGSSV
jgi:hypothetical protein